MNTKQNYEAKFLSFSGENYEMIIETNKKTFSWLKDKNKFLLNAQLSREKKADLISPRGFWYEFFMIDVGGGEALSDAIVLTFQRVVWKGRRES